MAYKKFLANITGHEKEVSEISAKSDLDEESMFENQMMNRME